MADLLVILTHGLKVGWTGLCDTPLDLIASPHHERGEDQIFVQDATEAVRRMARFIDRIHSGSMRSRGATVLGNNLIPRD